MKSILYGCVVMAVITIVAAVVFESIDRSAGTVYQSPSNVRL